jgi:peptidoglycan lytic transglycosylase
MMRKYYEIALIATSAIVASAQHSALARSASRHHRQPEPPTPRHAAGWVGETGEASYYSNFYHGRRAANGSRFDQRLLTTAHAWLPFGTKVRVTSASTGESVVVTVTDRIYSARRVIDLSVAAARKLGIMQSGIAEVSLAPV